MPGFPFIDKLFHRLEVSGVAIHKGNLCIEVEAELIAGNIFNAFAVILAPMVKHRITGFDFKILGTVVLHKGS